MKRNSSLLLLVLIFGLLFYSCDNKNNSKFESNEKKVAEFDLNVAKTEIQEITNQFTAAHISRDTAFLNNCFTKDARIFPPNSDVVTGKDDIAQLNYDWVSYGIHEFTEVSTSFYGNEEYLIDEGTYRLRYGEDNIIDEGKYVNIWENVNGTWKICSNIWNTSIPFEEAQ